MLMPPSARFTSLLATQRGALGAQTPPHLPQQMDGSFGQSAVMSGPSPLQYKDVGVNAGPTTPPKLQFPILFEYWASHSALLVPEGITMPSSQSVVPVGR